MKQADTHSNQTPSAAVPVRDAEAGDGDGDAAGSRSSARSTGHPPNPSQGKARAAQPGVARETPASNLPVPVNPPSESGVPEINGHGSSGQAERGGWLRRLLPKRRANTSNLRDDLSDVLESAGTEGHFTPEEKQMIHNILRLQDVRVEDLMVPRAEIEAVELDIQLGTLLGLFENSGHSRMPVYGETLDDPRGMVHIRDVMGYITRTAADGRKRKGPRTALDLARVDLTRELGKLNLVRRVLFVPPSMLAADLMARMQATRIQMALVIDEYGGTEGLISLEDIVEIIVGDIEDEHDDEDVLIQDLGDGRLICDARAEIDDISEMAGGGLEVGEHGEYADTIGGVIFSLIGRVPV